MKYFCLIFLLLVLFATGCAEITDPEFSASRSSTGASVGQSGSEEKSTHLKTHGDPRFRKF